MEGEEKEKQQPIEEESPRFEQASDGVSFREIALEKEKQHTGSSRMAELKRKINDDRAMLVLSGLCFIFSLLFFFLSFRYDTLKQRNFVPASLSFVVSVITITACIVLLTLGIIGEVRHRKAIREIEENEPKE